MSGKFRWEGHKVGMEERRDICKFWWGNLRERDHLEEPCVDGILIFRSIFRKLVVGTWTASSKLRLWRDVRYF